MKKGIAIVAIIVVILIILVNSCSGKSKSSSLNDWGSSQNWGKGYYWNSSSQSVERSFSGILEDAGW